MSHEPLTINNRLIVELCDYILKVLDIPKKSFHAFQEDIGPISKIFKICLDGSSSVDGAHLFQQIQTCENPEFTDMQQILLKII